jgi:hypothetical protein
MLLGRAGAGGALARRRRHAAQRVDDAGRSTSSPHQLGGIMLAALG